jgi:hypothetical protein
MGGGENASPAEKTQFDVILKSPGEAKAQTDKNGEFVIQITQDDLKKLPEYFEIMFTISPPENSGLSVKSNKNIISFYKYNITQFRFRLSFSNGYFIVEPVNQPNKLIVTRSDSGTRKVLDAFITATMKAEATEKSEPVPGAEIIVDQIPTKSPPKKDKKKSMIFTETGKSEEVVAHCYEVISDETINTFADNEGNFSIRIKDTQSRYVVLSVIPPQDSNYKLDFTSMLLKLPENDSDIYDLMLTYEYSEETKKGEIIIVGPIIFNPCSPLRNPTCKPVKCRMIGGGIGKCQYLYNSTTNEYICGCFYEVCNADCTGNCKMPDGGEGICHIEEITTIYNGAEIINKRCVCGPLDVKCNTNCSSNQDCITQTANQFPLCRTDMYGNSFCTQSCSQASDCHNPFHMCVKMGDDRGVCICPCVNADNAQAHCNQIGMYNAQCANLTFGTFTDCIDIDNDTHGECTSCCNSDSDCPAGMHCYDLLHPLNDGCKKACMCKEPVLQNLCKECKDDSNCDSGEVCIDDDNNPNTPKVCTVPCGNMGACPTSPVYTYCDYNVSRYCICKHPTVQVDCNYECKDNQDCITNTNGALDLCMPDTIGIKRCTKSCADVKECPAPYSMCVQYGDKSYCACPCIHFDTDGLTCNQYGVDVSQCIEKTHNSLPDCFDVDNDGSGECTHCCNDDSECPAGMICTHALNARCDKVCTCEEHFVSDVCQKCSKDSDCPSGFVCADDDNNVNTPNVCTRACSSQNPCPTSPVYTYCDNNVSRFCICKDGGVNLCEKTCEKDTDCPAGLFCADDDNNPNTPKICTKWCGDCPSPMVCNPNANYPAPVCMCIRDYCKTCKSDNDCGIGYKCVDSDSDPLTPNVCTTSCNNNYDCPLNLTCNPDLKVCDCNRCSKYSNPKCEPNKCYENGEFGKCDYLYGRCDCNTSGCIAPPFGMVAWWHFNETEGELANDIAGQVNNLGLLVNNVAMVPGMVGGAFSFNGTNYVEVADNPEINFGKGDFSIDLWINTSDSHDWVKTLIDKRTEDALNSTGYLFYLYKGRPGLQIGDGTKTNYNTSDIPNIPAINDGKWHHLAVTVQRSNPNGIKFYIDGALVAVFDPTAHMGDITNTSHLLIGNNLLSAGQSFIGILDEIELFNRVLSPDEVKAIYAAKNNGKCHPKIKINSGTIKAYLIINGRELEMGSYTPDENGEFVITYPEAFQNSDSPLVKYVLEGARPELMIGNPIYFIQFTAPQKGAKQGKHDAQKSGDQYVCEVRHF